MAPALALALVAAEPAVALTRVAAFEWAPASGPVAGYAVYATTGGSVDKLVGSVPGPSAEIAVESNEFVTISVAAYDSAGRMGPRSSVSAAVRLCPGDFDGDEVIGGSDWSDAQSCFGLAATGFCAGGDLDGNGMVGGTDITNLKIGSSACADTTCLGDWDGDQQVGMTDIVQARSCVGYPAQGSCALADLDGNGIVSIFDINALTSALGANACTL